MKQHITKAQWDELGEGGKILWIKYFCIQTRTGVIPCSDDFENELYPNIGQMIEFLGEDLGTIEFDDKCWVFGSKKLDGQIFKAKEPANALWKAVKLKLKE